MDSTITKEEVLPTIAQKINRNAEMRNLTEATMRGEIPFRTSFLRRVSEVAIGFGGVREIAPSLFRNINFAFYDDRRCAEFLWDLL